MISRHMAWKGRWSLWALFVALWFTIPVKCIPPDKDVYDDELEFQLLRDNRSENIIDTAMIDYNLKYIGDVEYHLNIAESIRLIEFIHEYSRLRYIHGYYTNHYGCCGEDFGECVYGGKFVYRGLLEEEAFLVSTLNSAINVYYDDKSSKYHAKGRKEFMERGYHNIARLSIMKDAGLIEFEDVNSKVISPDIVSVSGPNSTIIGTSIKRGMSYLERVMDAVIDNSKRGLTQDIYPIKVESHESTSSHTSNNEVVTKDYHESRDHPRDNPKQHNILDYAVLESEARTFHLSSILSSVFDNVLNVYNDVTGHDFIHKYGDERGNICHGIYGVPESVKGIDSTAAHHGNIFRKLNSPDNTTLYVFSNSPINKFLDDGCSSAMSDKDTGRLFCKSLINKTDTHTQGGKDSNRDNNFITNSELIGSYTFHRRLIKRNVRKTRREGYIELTRRYPELRKVHLNFPETLTSVTYPIALHMFLLPDNIKEKSNSLSTSLLCNMINTIMSNESVMKTFSGSVGKLLSKKGIKYEVVPELTSVICDAATPYFVVGLNKIPTKSWFRRSSRPSEISKDDANSMRESIADVLMQDKELHDDIINSYDIVRNLKNDKSCKDAINLRESIISRNLTSRVLGSKSSTSALGVLYGIADHESKGTLINNINSKNFSDILKILEDMVYKHDGIIKYLYMMGRGADFDGKDINTGLMLSIYDAPEERSGVLSSAFKKLSSLSCGFMALARSHESHSLY